jgi:UDP-galactopyranose mutase
MNFADEDMPFTRVHEFRHLHPERTVESERTITMHETSRRASRADEAFYPVNSPADHVTLNRYRDRMRAERNVVFGGRLGSYQYLDMHVAIASALTSFDGEVAPLLVAQEAGPA